jgi:AcrR family transcriptional regulator
MQAARILEGGSAVVNGDDGLIPEPAPARRTQAERTAATRGALLAAARRLFAEQGYSATGREEIVAAAGVTRGAMYHHFADKADLFRAVFETVEREVFVGVVAAATTSDDPVEQLHLGCHAYLDAAMDPGVRRICVVDAPVVLAEEVRAEISGRYGAGAIKEAVAAAVAQGRMPNRSIEALSRVLMAAVMAAAHFVATAEDTVAARAEAGATFDLVLDGLTVPPP